MMATYEPRDRFYRRARARGLPSRAAFKIEEILTAHRLLGAGARIADLGCAPGGWLAILARAAGPAGRVVGVDLAPVRAPAPNVATIVGDIRDAAVQSSVIGELGGKAGFVTSDLSPKLSGIAQRDEARAHELLDAALKFADSALADGGAMVAKLFMSGEFAKARAKFERCFDRVEVTRTNATRPGSSELYVIARGFHGRT